MWRVRTARTTPTRILPLKFLVPSIFPPCLLSAWLRRRSDPRAPRLTSDAFHVVCFSLFTSYCFSIGIRLIRLNAAHCPPLSLVSIFFNLLWDPFIPQLGQISLFSPLSAFQIYVGINVQHFPHQLQFIFIACRREVIHVRSRDITTMNRLRGCLLLKNPRGKKARIFRPCKPRLKSDGSLG